MLYAVDLTITAEKTMIVEAGSKPEAASRAIAKAKKRNHLFEKDDFIVLCGTSRVRELRGSQK